MNKKVISIIAIIALVAILGVCLVACNAETYAKRLEKAGYKVEIVDLSDEDKEEGVELDAFYCNENTVRIICKRDGYLITVVLILLELVVYKSHTA